MINMQGSGPEHWCLPIDCSITRIGHLDSGRQHWKLYMADKTNLDRQKLQAALHGSGEFDFGGREYRIDKTPTRKRKYVHIGMYFISPMLRLLFLMMWRSRRVLERNLGSQVATD
jgi:hypothetical protein